MFKNLAIYNFRKLVIEEMKAMGADEDELALIKNETIMNAIQKNREPKDVAWALLQ